MKILILANDDEGLYKFRKELVEALLKDNEVFISLPNGKYIPMLVEMGCTFIDTQFNRKGTNPIKDLELLSFYRKLLKKIKPNVVLTYTIKPNVYGGLACQLEKTPYIVNITGLGSALENGGLLEKIGLILYKIGLKGAKKVFFQNTMNRDYMVDRKIVTMSQSDLIPGSGVNIKEYKLLEYPNKENTHFVFIGRMMTEKGFGLYLEALKVLKEKYPNSYYHIAGEYEDDYKKQVEELIQKDLVIYHGSVINMVDEIYKNIHCSVMPTYYAEGMSNVLLESLACGRPIITTDRPGCKEVVEDGINGFVVKQKDRDDLIEKMEKFINLSYEDSKQMGINGRKKIEKEFDRSIVIDKYLKEIEKCA